MNISKLSAFLFPVALILSCTLASCSKSEYPPQHIIRLDQELSLFDKLDSTRQSIIADSLKVPIEAFFEVLGQPEPTISNIEWWSQSDVVAIFQPEVDSVFPNLDNLEQTLGNILGRANADSLYLPSMQFVSVVWAKPQPIIRIDTTMLIALNHYLGADYDGYAHFEEYRRMSKTPQSLPYDLAGAIVATQYPFNMDEAPTLLNWMLYEGALMEARMKLVPNAQLTLALGYRPDQLELLEDNFMTIWNELAIKHMIYDTDPLIIDRMLTNAPTSPVFAGRAPGRTGRYIGYKIVQSYLHNHRDTKLSFLLSPEFYANNKSLIESGIK